MCYYFKDMSDPDIPDVGGLSPFEEMPEITKKHEDCPVILPLLQKAMAARAIAQTLLETSAELPGKDEAAEAIEEMPDTIVDALRDYLMNMEGYEAEELEAPEQIAELMNKHQGEMTNRCIDEANEATLHLKRLLDNCVVGMTSTTVPRPNRRPARLTYCDGTVNAASFQQPVQTDVLVEEID